ncbi:MAG: hypothetical protein AAFP92_12565, partial [Bacteroidota bacterium]
MHAWLLLRIRISAFFLLLTLFFGTAQYVKASHSMGADLTYSCLGGNQYQINLTFYRDCSGVTPLPSFPVDIVSASCGQAAQVVLNQVATIDISPLCPAQQANSS